MSTPLKTTARRAGIIAAASVVLAGTAFSGPAMAAKGDFKGDPSFTGVTTNEETDQQGEKENATMFGAYLPSGGTLEGLRAWCMDAGLDWPYADGYSPKDVSSEKDPELAYILAKWDKERGDKAEQMSYDMAISEHVHGSKNLNHRDILKARKVSEVAGGIGWDMTSKNVKAVGKSTFEKSVLPDAVKYSKTMSSEAQKYAGNGQYTVKVDVTKDKDGATGKAEVSLVNSDGVNVPGFTGKISVDGGKAESATVKSATKPTTIDLDLDKGKAVKVNASFDSLPSSSVNVHKPKDYDAKDYDRYSLQQVVTKQTAAAEAVDTLDANSSPKVTTNISDKSFIGGDDVYDNFTISGLAEGQKVDVEHKLWASKTKPKLSDEVPADAKELGTVISKNVGNGDHKSATVTLPDDYAGYVVWTESIKPNDNNEGWEGKYGISEETGFSKYQPTVKTQVSESTVDSLPAKVHDTGTIEDCAPGSEITIKTETYFESDGVIEQSKEVPADAKKVDEVTQKVECDDDGTATYETTPLEIDKDAIKPGEKGALAFVVSGEESEFNTEFADDYGVPSEVVSIELPTPQKPETPKPETPDAPAPEDHEVKTGAHAEAEEGMNVGLIGGGLAGLLAAAGASTWALVRRNRNKADNES